MSLNETPSSNRLHIGFFGRTNAGKSSLVNAITGQQMAIVSDVKGTTTDPVQKAMELLPIGPVVIIDTPGLDDTGNLGEQRIKKTFEILRKTDFVVLVVDGKNAVSQKHIAMSEYEQRILQETKERKLPYIVAVTKEDTLTEEEKTLLEKSEIMDENSILLSNDNEEKIKTLKELMGKIGKGEGEERPLIRDLLEPEDVVVLVTPIDEAAPKGRMILPQQQTIRDILDADAICMVCKEHQLTKTLASLEKSPKLVVTDSQAFKLVDKLTPKDIALTSFSILFARKKGNLELQVAGAEAISQLEDGDRILISEGCTHHRQCGDIGTQKLPKLIRKFTGKDVCFEFTSGNQFKEELSKYRLIIHCGACMLNEQEMKYRLKYAQKCGIPMTNYGVAIAYMNGILYRSLELFQK